MLVVLLSLQVRIIPPAKDRYLVAEPVYISWKVINDETKEVEIEAIPANWQVVMRGEMWKEDGAPVREKGTISVWKCHPCKSRIISLAPGETLSYNHIQLVGVLGWGHGGLNEFPALPEGRYCYTIYYYRTENGEIAEKVYSDTFCFRIYLPPGEREALEAYKEVYLTSRSLSMLAEHLHYLLKTYPQSFYCVKGLKKFVSYMVVAGLWIKEEERHSSEADTLMSFLLEKIPSWKGEKRKLGIKAYIYCRAVQGWEPEKILLSLKNAGVRKEEIEEIFVSEEYFKKAIKIMEETIQEKTKERE